MSASILRAGIRLWTKISGSQAFIITIVTAIVITTHTLHYPSPSRPPSSLPSFRHHDSLHCDLETVTTIMITRSTLA